MSKYHILLDSFKLQRDQADPNTSYPLSEYIRESRDFEKTPFLNNTPSLLKFITSEKKDFIENLNENKFRAIKDNVTDSFVNVFFINNYEKLNMLIDYQYHFIYFNIMLEVNNRLMQQGPSNRNGEKIEKEFMYPLQDNEHILLNFKGGSTMYYLYNNIINHLRTTGIDVSIFDNIKKYFKISDIDLALNIETGNSYRYFQLESIVSHLLTSILEDLTNRLEFMYLNTIHQELDGGIGNDPDVLFKIQNLRAALNLDETTDSIDVTIELSTPNKETVYDDIYKMKTDINTLKKRLIDNLNLVNVNEGIAFITKFIEYRANPKPHFILKSVDMLEISLLLEFVTFMAHLKYNFNGGVAITAYATVIRVFSKLREYGKHLLNVKYKYLLDNLYSTNHLDTFIKSINTSLKGVNKSSLDKAIDSYATEIANGRLRPRICETPLVNTAAGDYYQDYRYFTDSKSERKSYYNLVSDANITNDKINFSGRENFFLRPQDSSRYPYVIVTTTDSGLNSRNIKDLKDSIVKANGNSTNVVVKFPGNTTKTLDFSNDNNIHYLSINKSIFIENNRFVTTFNLFRIKFNVILSDLVESIEKDKVSNNCIANIIPSINAPSEFLDVGVGSKDDTFHRIIDEIEEHNHGIVFKIKYNPGSVPPQYGINSRILSYNVLTFAADLNNVLYCQQAIPWLDLKYEKRLFRLLFYIFNVLNNESKVKNLPDESANAIINNVFKPLFDNIDENLITYDNIVTNNADFNINGTQIGTMINQFSSALSIPNAGVFITSDIIKDLILSDRELYNHLLLQPKYKIGNGFFSYTIIYIVLLKKLRDEIAFSSGDTVRIIAEYSNIIQMFYSRSNISFNVKNYTDVNEMNQFIVKGFINDFGLYIKNIKSAVGILEMMFTADFSYSMYESLPIDS